MRRVASAGLVAAALVVAGGCGTSSGGGSSSSQKPSFAAFSQCLKKHGATLPSGGQGFGGAPPSGGQFNGQPPSGGGFPGISSKMRKAFRACQSLAPQRQGNAPGFGSSRS
jgi:hypothetical protein